MNITNDWPFVGQENIIKRLKIMIAASKIKQLPLEHTLLIGPAGMGKTTIAKLISQSLASNLHFVQGSAINKPSDIISILTNLKVYDVVFIDEIHIVNQEILEALYTALEGNYLNIFIGKDFNNKIIKIDLPRFTFIGATNKVGYLTKALLSRIPNILHLQSYQKVDIANLIKWQATKLNWDLAPATVSELVNYCQYIPRLVINMVHQIYNYVLVTTQDINQVSISKIMDFFHIYRHGLGDLELNYLKLFSSNSDNYYSLETLSHLLNEDRKNIEDYCEPVLLKLGLIVKTSKGRKITELGKTYCLSYEK